ncbi:MAG TPA: extracellular solute-binding protein [Planctomycetota bacterium]|jgi:multiple sugar transport system substrate-binding protein
MNERSIRGLFVIAVLALLAGCGSDTSQSGKSAGAKKTLSITWAAWPPADVLATMAREWGAANNVEIKTEFIPWSDFKDKIYAEFEKKSGKYDIVIGDSQWTGKGASEGHYLDITDWLKGLPNFSEIEPAALTSYCEYPRGSGRYFAAPCELDACGFAYRKDWFEDAKEKEAFKAKYNRELEVPKTWAELKDIAEFFHRPDQKQYGISLFTDNGQYDAVTMGFMQVMLAYGGNFCDQEFKVDGQINSKQSVEALTFYKSLCAFMPPDSEHFYHRQCLDAHENGSVAMSMHFFALMPELTDPEKCKCAKATGFFAAPAGPAGRFASLGGTGFSIMKHTTPEKQQLARRFIQWFLQTENQKKWGSYPGCFSANMKANSDPAVFSAAPFNVAFHDTLPLLRDFYNTPEYAELMQSCQEHWHAALYGKETPQQALDLVAKEHTEIHKKAGVLK